MPVKNSKNHENRLGRTLELSVTRYTNLGGLGAYSSNSFVIFRAAPSTLQLRVEKIGNLNYNNEETMDENVKMDQLR